MELQAFQQLLDQHAAPLELYAAQWTCWGEDCVQEAFIELANQSSCPDQPIPWLYRVTRNKALNANRADQRRSNHERLASLLIAGDEKPRSKYQHDFQERLDAAREALSFIPAEERELVVLRIWSGLSWQEIADLTDSSTSTAHRRYVAVLQKLKLILEPTCPTNSNFPTN